MTKKELIDATQMAGGSTPVGATISADGRVDQAALRQAEQAVTFEWHPGDVILDLYEVRRVTEGFGDEAEEKNYHEGGFGRVYKVWHRTWHREMAVKTPRAGAFTTQAQKDAFTRECETWVNLGLHAHIAACHYVRELGGVPRIFSEYAEAGTLEEWIRSERLYEGDEQTALARMLDVSIQFAWGLHAAHEKGVIHQDVKPLNALLWNDGTLKVTDFGLAEARQKVGIADMAGEGVGGMQSIMVSMGGMTPSHCSPEQAAGQMLDRRTDVWSWAVSVLEIFQGEVTWQSGSLTAEALEAFLKNGGKEEGIPAMPAGVAALLRQCFQPNPAARPRTLRDCATALHEVYEAETRRPYPRAEPQAVGDTPDALNNRALSLLDLGKPDEAEQLFDRALDLDKHHIAATYNRGLMHWRTGRRLGKDALVSLQEIKQDHPGDAAVECALGWMRMERGHFTEARAHFEKAIEPEDVGEARAGLEHARPLAELVAGYPRTLVRAGTVGDVNSVAYSPDGRFALSGSSDETLRLWDVASGQCLRTFKGHTRRVVSVAFSPDGRYALSGSRDRNLIHVKPVADKSPKLWDLTTGQCLRALQEDCADVNAVAFSPDGRFALSGSSDGMLRLWDVATWQCLRTFEGHTSSVYSAAFSPDGRFALSGAGDYDEKPKKLRLWDVATGQCLRTFDGHTYFVNAVAFSPDGRFALSGTGDSTLRLWDVATGQCLRKLEGHAKGVSSVAFSPDGRFALSGSYDTTLRLWDVDTGQCLRSCEGHTDLVHAVAFSPDGRFALSGSEDGSIRLWEVASAMDRPYVSPWFYAMVVSVEEALERQRLHKAHLSHARLALESGKIAEALAFLREARSVQGFEKDAEGLDLMVLVGTRARVKSYGGAWLERTFQGHEDSVKSVVFSSDGHFALSGSYGTLHLWDVATGRCVRSFCCGDREPVEFVAFSPDARFVRSESDRRTLRLWNLSSGQCVRTFKNPKHVTSVANSPDGCLALCDHGDWTLCLWDVATGKSLRTFGRYASHADSVVFSPNGHFALSAHMDNTLQLWDVGAGQLLRKFGGKGHGPLRFSPNGRLALSGNLDNTLKLWDVATGECLRTLVGHTKEVNSVAFSPDGCFALSGGGEAFSGKDSAVRLWDVTTGQCLRTLDGHTNSVNSVVFSPDGRFALSGSDDKTLRLWELDWEYEYDPEDDPVLKSRVEQA